MCITLVLQCQLPPPFIVSEFGGIDMPPAVQLFGEAPFDVINNY